MLEMLKRAIEIAPNGCKIDITFHDNERIESVKAVAADELGIVTEDTNPSILHRMIPWTAIAVLHVHHY